MSLILNILSIGCSIVSLVCFVMVVIQMFKRDESTMGIVSLVTLLLCGIGVLIAFVYGWTKVTAWDIKNIMLAWTGAFVLNLILTIVGTVLAVGSAAATMNSGDFDMENMNVQIEGADFGMEDFELEMPDAATEE